ncbi:MAG: phosphoenolpyruvate--protein phosphotransferase [Steroidobacteraceae bacterium]
MSALVLVSPLAGWSTPLEEVPDPVFAGRMLGDGVAIDPLGSTLHAPCDGEVVLLPETRHAVTLRTARGLEVLMHLGIDTVGLGGEGFEALVALGQPVRTGDALIRFDLDLLARRARSLLTPILVVGGTGTLARRVQGCPVTVGEVLMEWVPAGVAADRAAARTGAREARSRTVRVALEHGIHARPAAQLAAAIAGLEAEVSLHAAGRQANARSVVALMTLGVRGGGQVEIRAAGPDAPAAIEAIEAVLSVAAPVTALNTPARAAMSDPVQVAPAQPEPLRCGAVLRGVVASRGFAVGRAAVLHVREVAPEEAGGGCEHETRELDRAQARVRAALEQARSGATGPAAEVIEAHLALLADPYLQTQARSWIGRGKSAGYAWRAAIRESVAALRALGDARMAERADDLTDLERQVLLALAGEPVPAAAAVPPGSILIARELLPSQLVRLDAERLAGICLAAGGATSHVSILAAAAGIPALVALGPAVGEIVEDTALILDAEVGELHVDPGEPRVEAARARMMRNAERRARERQAAQRECRMADGTRIEVLANLGSLADAEAAMRNGAEGCGLLRTEFLFLERRHAPSETEQRDEYQRIARALAGKPLTIRTLDIGGDKPIDYLPLPREENPALGLRGVRTSLWREDLLDEQLRAVLAVEPAGQCRILLPMITDVAELRAVRARLLEASRRVGRTAPIELGVMIETPASALIAAVLAREAEFFSIGTNDLTQYTLAMDRGHPQLAARLDGLHPAVLTLIARTAEAARAQGRGVAVCGGLAADPAAVPILIGLGVRELSCAPAAIPGVKALIGELTLEQCKRWAREALEQESAEAVRALSGVPAGKTGEPELAGACAPARG